MPGFQLTSIVSSLRANSPIRKVANHGETGAAKWRQGHIVCNCTRGARVKKVMGFPPHHSDGFPLPSQVPPKRNPKPRCTPRRQGFSFAIAGKETAPGGSSARPFPRRFGYVAVTLENRRSKLRRYQYRAWRYGSPQSSTVFEPFDILQGRLAASR